MDASPVTVAIVGSRMEGEMVVGLLASHGVRAIVAADDAGGQEPQLQLQGVRVLVGRADESEARELLADVATGARPGTGSD